MERTFRPLNPAPGSSGDFWWRRVPGRGEFDVLNRACIETPGRPTVFLQGAAVDWLIEPIEWPEGFPAAADWWVCIGSWRRRSAAAAEPPAPFRSASLAQWIDRLVPGSPSGTTGNELLFVIDRDPSGPRDRVETLEPVLAAAALDRDVAVLFEGPGLRHLTGAGAEAWDQLIDFELAELFRLEPRCEAGSMTGQVGVQEPGTIDRGRSVSPDEAASLRREAGKLIGL